MDCTPKLFLELDCGLHSKNAGVSNALLLDTGDENDCIQFKKRTPGSTGPPPLRRDLVFRLDRNFTPWHGRTPPADGPTAGECRWGCRGGGSERASCNLESQISMGHSKISARRESRYHERTHEPFARKWQLPMPSSSSFRMKSGNVLMERTSESTLSGKSE